jgi:hypothetical protein
VYPIPLEFLGQIPGLPPRDLQSFVPSAQIEKAGGPEPKYLHYIYCTVLYTLNRFHENAIIGY